MEGHGRRAGRDRGLDHAQLLDFQVHCVAWLEPWVCLRAVHRGELKDAVGADGAEAGGGVLALGRPEATQHLVLLEVAGGPVAHDHVPGDVLLSTTELELVTDEDVWVPRVWTMDNAYADRWGSGGTGADLFALYTDVRADAGLWTPPI